MEASICTSLLLYPWAGIHKREKERYIKNKMLTLLKHSEKIRLSCVPRISCLISQRVWHDIMLQARIL